MKQQTAVQCFWNKIALKLSVEQVNEFLPEFEQAKEMEKEQIIDAWIATDNELQRIAAEKYYNETFKTK
jgi:hypothetical protein